MSARIRILSRAPPARMRRDRCTTYVIKMITVHYAVLNSVRSPPPTLESINIAHPVPGGADSGCPRPCNCRHMSRSARNLPPFFAMSGFAPCTIGVPAFSPLLQTPYALTFLLPPSVFEIPSVSAQNQLHHTCGVFAKFSTMPKRFTRCAVNLLSTIQR